MIRPLAIAFRAFACLLAVLLGAPGDLGAASSNGPILAPLGRDSAPLDRGELQRWGFLGEILPVGSITQFRQTSFRDRWWIVATVSFLLFQTALITGLLVTRRRLLQAKAQAALVAEISSRFVNLPPGEVDREIVEAQHRLCMAMGIDASVLWQPSDDSPGDFIVTHIYRHPDAPEFPHQLARRDFPWTAGELLAGRIAVVSSLADLPPQAAIDAASARGAGIRSAVMIPLIVGGAQPIGLLSFNATRAQRRWRPAVVELLVLVAQIFGSALARRRADQALRESEERMSMASEAARFGVWVWHLGRNEVWGSEQWMKLFGFVSPSPIRYEDVLERIHPEDREGVDREVRRTIAGQAGYSGEFRLILPDGTVRWIASQGRAKADENGTPSRVLGAAIDITERKRADEAFRLGEARLAAGAELVGLGYYEIDYAAKWCFADDRCRDIWGLGPDAFEGLQPAEFWIAHVHPDYESAIMEMRRSLLGGAADRVSAEYRYLHPVKGVRWIHQLARIVARGRHGASPRTVGVVRDITREKQAQTEMLELQARLSHAGRVNVLGQLSSALAHELSQPLGAILRNAEAAGNMLRGASPDLEELRAIITDIRDDDRRAALVIDRLRSLLKRRTLDPQPIELPEVLNEVLSLVRTDAASRQVRLVSTIAAETPPVSGDRIHLQQVLLNLLVNAMDAIAGQGSGRGSIEISARRTTDDTVEVRVADDGPGLPADTLDRVFEAFFTTKANGMGMGLAVSRTIVEAHNGRLWAENRPEGGACFIFTLPVAATRSPATGGRAKS